MSLSYYLQIFPIISLIYMHKKPLRYFYRKGLFVFLPSFLTRRRAVDLFNYKCIELFNDSFYSFFAFNSNYNYTLRSSDYSVA